MCTSEENSVWRGPSDQRSRCESPSYPDLTARYSAKTVKHRRTSNVLLSVILSLFVAKITTLRNLWMLTKIDLHNIGLTLEDSAEVLRQAALRSCGHNLLSHSRKNLWGRFSQNGLNLLFLLDLQYRIAFLNETLRFLPLT